MRVAEATYAVAATLMMASVALAQQAPTPAPPAPPRAYFPALPPSRPCKSEDVIGAWKLVQVYEDPQGAETAAFASQPNQYLSLTPEQTYKYVKPVRGETSVQDILNSLQRTEADGLTQYVIGDSGVMYFYSEGVAVDTQVCFIVTNPRGQFAVGQMLILPPAPSDGNVPSVRIAKQYSRYGDSKVDQQANNKNKKKDKKNRKKRRGRR